jgi:branched-subunit amino acid ABC-type transport system permease component
MTVLNAVLQGIFLGAFYAVLACGLSLMFGVMRIINLAHGDIAVLGAYIVFFIVENTGASAFVAFAAALPVMIVLGFTALNTLGLLLNDFYLALAAFHVVVALTTLAVLRRAAWLGGAALMLTLGLGIAT